MAKKKGEEPNKSVNRPFEAMIKVKPKPGILDPAGQAIQNVLVNKEYPVTRLRVGKLFEIEVKAADGAAARALLEEIGSAVLANPLIEVFEIENLDEEKS